MVRFGMARPLGNCGGMRIDRIITERTMSGTALLALRRLVLWPAT